MDDAWEILKEAGLPDGVARRPVTVLPPEDQIQAALRAIELKSDALETRDLELLHAWLQAGFHHWPSRFGRVAGQAGARICDRLIQSDFRGIDRSRYLKLRRIAVANLSASL